MAMGGGAGRTEASHGILTCATWRLLYIKPALLKAFLKPSRVRMVDGEPGLQAEMEPRRRLATSTGTVLCTLANFEKLPPGLKGTY